MRKLMFSFLCLSFFSSVFAQEYCETSPSRCGKAAGYATRDATVLSMMGWGIGLTVGFAALCALIDNHGSASHS